MDRWTKVCKANSNGEWVFKLTMLLLTLGLMAMMFVGCTPDANYGRTEIPCDIEFEVWSNGSWYFCYEMPEREGPCTYFTDYQMGDISICHYKVVIKKAFTTHGGW